MPPSRVRKVIKFSSDAATFSCCHYNSVSVLCWHRLAAARLQQSGDVWVIMRRKGEVTCRPSVLTRFHWDSIFACASKEWEQVDRKRRGEGLNEPIAGEWHLFLTHYPTSSRCGFTRLNRWFAHVQLTSMELTLWRT